MKKFFTKLFAALNPNSQPINPPTASGSQIVSCGFDTALPVGNYDHSGLEQLQRAAKDYIIRDDPYRYGILNAQMPMNVWHHD